MSQNIVSAVFDSRSEAETAVNNLRAAGVTDHAISVVARHDGNNTTTTDGSGAEVAKDVVGTAAVGAGAGALLGIAALAIPGVGPFIAAGAIAEVAIGGAAVTGTILGATAGGLAGALRDHGVSSEDSVYYEDRIGAGGTFVSVDTSSLSVDAAQVSDMLYQAGGHSASHAHSH
jgi:hypothetical protein